MTQDANDLYARTMAMLGPALERVAADAAFRDRLEMTPLAALAEMRVEVDEATRRALEGRRFSEFWAERRKQIEGTLGVRDLPPEAGALTDAQLDKVSGGFGLQAISDPRPRPLDPGQGGPMGPMNPRFAPPYVPVGPAG